MWLAAGFFKMKDLLFYMAPMEGVTGYIYRQAYHQCFAPMDRYFTPFIAPKQTGNSGTEARSVSISTRERRDILPEHNRGMRVVPQILTNRWEDFLQTCGILKEEGYREVNLNLGCPSGTVTAKKKGAGFLGEPEQLEDFLLRVSQGVEEMGMELSVKTRLGVEEPGEFEYLLRIYNRVPLKELIVHPRVLKDYYGNKPRLEWFGLALAESRAPVCYNGDIFSPKDLEALKERFCPGQGLERIMLGRGLIRNPGLAGELAGQRPAEISRLRRSHDLLWRGYLEMMGEERNALFKMKELWSYMQELFRADSRLLKKLKKSKSGQEYLETVEEIFETGLKN